MPAQRKYDDETRARAVRMYQDRLDADGESKLAARTAVGELLGVNPATLRGWIERAEIDSGQRPGVSSDTAAELATLRKDNAELRRANDILKTASAFFAQAELDRRLK